MRVDCLKKLRGRVCPPRYLFNKILQLGVEANFSFKCPFKRSHFIRPLERFNFQLSVNSLAMEWKIDRDRIQLERFVEIVGDPMSG